MQIGKHVGTCFNYLEFAESKSNVGGSQPKRQYKDIIQACAKKNLWNIIIKSIASYRIDQHLQGSGTATIRNIWAKLRTATRRRVEVPEHKRDHPFKLIKHVVRNLNVRPDSSLWHSRDNSVLLGSCEFKQGQGGQLGHGGMWKMPWIQLSSWGNNITWSPWGNKIRHPLWPICWTG